MSDQKVLEIPIGDECPACGGSSILTTSTAQEPSEMERHGWDWMGSDGDAVRCSRQDCTEKGELDTSSADIAYVVWLDENGDPRDE